MDGPSPNDTELMSQSIQIEQKLFYLDLKENYRSRYLKISEKAGGSRSTIIVPLAGIVWFVDLFNYYSNGAEAELSSKELQLDTKVFFFDVGQNPRGRFLKVSEASMSRARSTIIVPAGAAGADGWATFRNALVKIHEASLALPPHPHAASTAAPPGLSSQPAAAVSPAAAAAAASVAPQAAAKTADASRVGQSGIGVASTYGAVVQGSVAGTAGDVGGVDASQLGGAVEGQDDFSRTLRIEQKRFFFDLGSNNRGQFLKISEVAGADRSSIILPASAIEQFHEVLGHFAQVLRSQSDVK